LRMGGDGQEQREERSDAGHDGDDSGNGREMLLLLADAKTDILDVCPVWAVKCPEWAEYRS